MVSAVLLAYNRKAEALLTISKLTSLRSTLPFDMEIIVVDNASNDETSNSISSQYPHVKLITRNKNNGVAGWNDGFEVANQPYLLVLDDDSHIHEGLADAVAYMEENNNVGILGFEIVDQNLKGDPLLDPELAWKHLEKIAGFIGCGALIKREVYEKIGGFSEWLFIYTHEFDYSIRALQAGFETIFFAQGIVVHRASKLNRTNRRLRIFSTRNEMAIVYCYFTKQRNKYLWRVWFNNFKFIKREGVSAGYYVLLGAIEFFKMRKSLVRKPVSNHVQDYFTSNFWSTKV